MGLRLGVRGVALREAGRRRLRAFVHSTAGGVRGARWHCGRRCDAEEVRRRRRRRPLVDDANDLWRPASAVWFLACSVFMMLGARDACRAPSARGWLARHDRGAAAAVALVDCVAALAPASVGRPGERGAAGRRRAGVRVAAARVAGAGARRGRGRRGRGRRRRAGWCSYLISTHSAFRPCLPRCHVVVRMSAATAAFPQVRRRDPGKTRRRNRPRRRSGARCRVFHAWRPWLKNAAETRT